MTFKMMLAFLLLIACCEYTTAQWGNIDGIYGSQPYYAVSKPGEYSYLLTSNKNIYIEAQLGGWQHYCTVPPGSSISSKMYLDEMNEIWLLTNSIYRFVPNLGQWVRIPGPNGDIDPVLFVLPVDRDNVFACVDRDIYRSTDEGVSWLMILENVNYSADDRSSMLLYDPSGRLILQETDSTKISYDMGDNWEGYENKYSTEHAPSSDIRHSFVIRGRGVIKNTQDGLLLFEYASHSWKYIRHYSENYLGSSVYVSKNYSIVGVGALHGELDVWRSSDFGDTWADSRIMDLHVLEPVVFQMYDSVVIIRDDLPLVYQLNCGENAWSFYHGQMKEPLVTKLAVGDSSIYASSRFVLYRYSAGNKRWDEILGNTMDLGELILSSDGTLVRATAYSMKWSTNRGNTWDDYIPFRNYDRWYDKTSNKVLMVRDDGVYAWSIGLYQVDRITDVGGGLVAGNSTGLLAVYDNGAGVRIVNEHMTIGDMNVSNCIGSPQQILLSTDSIVYMVTDSALYYGVLGEKVMRQWQYQDASAYGRAVLDEYGNIYLIINDSILVVNNITTGVVTKIREPFKGASILDIKIFEGKVYVLSGSGVVFYADCTNLLSVFDFGQPRESLYITAWPNPSSGIVNIQWTLTNLNSVKMRIYDQLGRTVHTKEIQLGSTSATWNASNAAPGIYFMQIMHEEGIETGKVMVR